MPSPLDLPAYDYREVLRNRYVTSFGCFPLVATLGHLITGLLFIPCAVGAIVWYVLGAIYVVFGWDPLSFGKDEDPPGLGLLCWGLLMPLFFSIGSHWFLGGVWRRARSRLHVLAGLPLASVEGPPDFDFGESDCWGVKVAGRYFDFRECYLEGVDVNKLAEVRGLLRIWYVASTGIFVRADWRFSH